MEPIHFVCPYCSAALKTRDRLSVGRPVPCPECRQTFVLGESKTGLVAEKKAPDPSTDTAQFPPLTIGKANSRRRLIAVSAIGGTALLVLVLLAGLLLQRPSASHPRRTAAANGKVEGVPPGKGALVEGGKEKSKPAGVKPVKPAAQVERKLTEVEKRLERIGQVLKQSSRVEKAFPAGTLADGKIPVGERLSWQAELADRFDPGANVPVVRDRGWQDPLNDPFVRRRLTYYQNPEVVRLTGEDGYPATHFVGVAGVGPDGPRLPATDPKAGVFADDRRTRITEIRDGLTNTMLVAGVHDKLGSWASGGSATIRPFTAEPYVNGPDGFGTGLPDSMFVLMADGRVMTIQKNADPAVVRSLAAITDETLHRESLQPAAPVAKARIDNRPLLPEFTPEPVAPAELPPPVRTVAEIEASLDQSLVAFTFPLTSPSLLVLVREVAELTGVPVSFEPEELGAAAEALHHPLVPPKTATLKNPKVRDVLTILLRPAGLTVKPAPGTLRLVRIDGTVQN